MKAELGYSAADYFSLVYGLITNRPEVNMEDLTGTELEERSKPRSSNRPSPKASARRCGWATRRPKAARTPSTAFSKTIATYSNNNKVYTYNYETDAMNTPANSVAMFDDLLKKCGRTPERP